MDLIDCFMRLGFTRHESMLYVTLCSEGELTGYEASKISGIPRSNAYLALAGLAEKGGVYRIEGDSARYSAVPPKELVLNLKREFHEVLNFIEKNAPGRSAAVDSYITISGRSNIINKMKNIVNEAKERVYLSMAPAEMEHIAAETGDAVRRGLKVVVISSPGFRAEGTQIFFNKKQPGQIRIIADSSQVLTGELSETEATCLYSKNKNLVNLIKDSLTNEIKLIEIQEKNNPKE